MQVTIQIPDEKRDFVLELLQSLPFVRVTSAVSESMQPAADEKPLEKIGPKTSSLLGAFPMLSKVEHDRVQAIINKHG